MKRGNLRSSVLALSLSSLVLSAVSPATAFAGPRGGAAPGAVQPAVDNSAEVERNRKAEEDRQAAERAREQAAQQAQAEAARQRAEAAAAAQAQAEAARQRAAAAQQAQADAARRAQQAEAEQRRNQQAQADAAAAARAQQEAADRARIDAAQRAKDEAARRTPPPTATTAPAPIVSRPTPPVVRPTPVPPTTTAPAPVVSRPTPPVVRPTPTPTTPIQQPPVVARPGKNPGPGNQPPVGVPAKPPVVVTQPPVKGSQTPPPMARRDDQRPLPVRVQTDDQDRQKQWRKNRREELEQRLERIRREQQDEANRREIADLQAQIAYEQQLEAAQEQQMIAAQQQADEAQRIAAQQAYAAQQDAIRQQMYNDWLARSPRSQTGGRTMDLYLGRGTSEVALARRAVITQRREIVREAKLQEQNDTIALRSQLMTDRVAFNEGNQIRIVRNNKAIQDTETWTKKYSLWYRTSAHPQYPTLSADPQWFQAMPDVGDWSYGDLEVIAVNLEYKSREAYVNLAQLQVSDQLAPLLLSASARLTDAAIAYSDAVLSGSDTTDSLKNLFYLDSELAIVERELANVQMSDAALDDVQLLRFYVNELLLDYRINF